MSRDWKLDPTFVSNFRDECSDRIETPNFASGERIFGDQGNIL